ncbi:MAG: ATP-binding protein [Chloroflexota bacterium]
MATLIPSGRLEDQDRDQLVVLARRLLVEADALSSRIAAVNEIGVAINRTLDLDAIQRVIAKQAKWLLDFEHCSVCLQDSSDDSWKINTLFGPAETEPLNILETENVGQVLRGSHPRLILDGSPSPFLKVYPSQMIVPLIADDIMMGTINFASTKVRAYSQDDMRIGYMLALQLSSAIRNARTFEELKRTRDELRTYADALEARNQELDAYSHTIAHDLKSPLSSIILKSELTVAKAETTLPASVLEAFQGIKERGLLMNDMIDQLLWLAKLRNVQEAVTPVDMNTVAAAALTRLKPLIEERKIAIELAREMPSALGQALWLEEVFANLISNAVKYMGSANPAPKIRILGLRQDEMVRYEVQDTGVGIAQENQARLFAMFTRLHTVETEGLGLGLSIVHRIVTKLNGSVGVTSQPGTGSTFWFTLPSVPEKQIKGADNLLNSKSEDVPDDGKTAGTGGR